MTFSYDTDTTYRAHTASLTHVWHISHKKWNKLMHTIHGNTQITIGTFNLNGLASDGRTHKFSDAFAYSTYDIMMINEHNLNKHRITEWSKWLSLNHPELSIWLSPVPPHERRGGTGFIVKHEKLGLSPSSVTVVRRFGGRATRIHWEDAPSPLRLLSIYLPPQPQLRRALWKRITDSDLITRDTIVAGDFNIVPDTGIDVLYNVESHSRYSNDHSHTILSSLYSKGLYDITRRTYGKDRIFTHCTDTVNTRIDLIFLPSHRDDLQGEASIDMTSFRSDRKSVV